MNRRGEVGVFGRPLTLVVTATSPQTTRMALYEAA